MPLFALGFGASREDIKDSLEHQGLRLRISVKLQGGHYTFHYSAAKPRNASVDRKAAKTNPQERLLTEGL
jgi:hypothetical protein